MNKKFWEMSLEEIARADVACACGQRHSTGIEHIVVENGALEKLPGLLESQRRQDGAPLDRTRDGILITEDRNTRRVAGDRVYALLTAAGWRVERCFFDEDEPLACDTNYERVRALLRPETALLIAVGSGTLNDVTKYAAFLDERPFYIVGTAPSMDGYASCVAPMILGSLKFALDAKGPAAIICDIDVIKQAPLRLMAAGFGDLAGKCIGICEWKMSELIQDEAFCPEIAETVLRSVDACARNIDGLLRREDEAVKNVTEALILVGLMMSYAKSSRPASGMEHSLAHFWELMQLFEDLPLSLHGEAVGVGSVVICAVYERLLCLAPDFDKGRRMAGQWDRAAWEAEIARFCRRGADKGTIALEDQFKKNQLETVLPRLARAEARWDELTALARRYVPAAREMKASLERARAMTAPQELGIREEHFTGALLYSKDTRYRYGVLQLLWDLGELDRIAEEIHAQFYPHA